MPIVRIDIQSGKTTAYKRDILHGVRAAIVEALGVPDERVMQRLIETPADDIDAPEIRSDRLTIIEISMLPGRGPDLKEALYSAIVQQSRREARHLLARHHGADQRPGRRMLRAGRRDAVHADGRAEEDDDS